MSYDFTRNFIYQGFISLNFPEIFEKMYCKLRQKDNVIMDRTKPLSEPARDTNRQF